MKHSLQVLGISEISVEITPEGLINILSTKPKDIEYMGDLSLETPKLQQLKF